MAKAKETRFLVTLPGGGKLRGDAAASYLRMRADGMPAGGVDVFYRSLAKQTELYHLFLEGKGNLAAKPSPNAPHVRGMAMDLHTGGKGPYSPSEAHVWLTKGGHGELKPQPGEQLRSHTYGWRRTVPSERWHFGYSAEGDTKRAADLKARLQLLGFDTVADFQRDQGLKVDGKDGPATWQALLAVTGASGAVTMKPAALKFRFGHSGFTPDDVDPGTARGTWLATKLGCSVYALTGVPESVRDAIRDALGGQTEWRVYPIGNTTVLWNAAKWLHTGRADVSFADAEPAGAVRAQLTSRSNGRSLDVIAVQARAVSGFAAPADAEVGQQGDLTMALKALRRAKVPTILAGDVGGGAASVLTAVGFTRASNEVPDDPGRQVWLSPGIAVRTATPFADPTVLAAWRMQLTLPRP